MLNSPHQSLIFGFCILNDSFIVDFGIFLQVNVWFICYNSLKLNLFLHHLLSQSLRLRWLDEIDSLIDLQISLIVRKWQSFDPIFNFLVNIRFNLSIHEKVGISPFLLNLLLLPSQLVRNVQLSSWAENVNTFIPWVVKYVELITPTIIRIDKVGITIVFCVIFSWNRCSIIKIHSLIISVSRLSYNDLGRIIRIILSVQRSLSTQVAHLQIHISLNIPQVVYVEWVSIYQNSFKRRIQTMNFSLSFTIYERRQEFRPPILIRAKNSCSILSFSYIIFGILDNVEAVDV